MTPPTAARTASAPRVLMIDVGGSNVKLMISGSEEMRKFPSSRQMTAAEMVAETRKLVKDWAYDVVTLGYPGLVKDGRLVREPLNLGGSWMTFNFERAFRRPVRIINDAALQALAVYRGGRMLFVGFGTSIGCALIADDVIVPIELGLIPMGGKEIFMTRLTKAARKDGGHTKWQKGVHQAVALLRDVFFPEDTVVGGGNAKVLDPFPDSCRPSHNRLAHLGASRLWEGADLLASPHGTTWRITWFQKPVSSPNGSD
jgi:predicted NBD/HSP70 family sugar kinase